MGRLRLWWQGLGRDIQIAVPLFVFSRLGLLLVGWLGSVWFLTVRLPPSAPPQTSIFIDMWDRWDAIWYLDLAKGGYAHHSYAFLPGLPLLIHLATPLFLGHARIAGLVVTSGAFFLDLVLLYRLVARQYGDRVAERTALYLILFPTAFYFAAIYTEPVYLLFTLLALSFAQRERWFLAGLAGGFSALTRNEGVLLVLPLLWEYYRRRRFQWKETRWNLLGLAIIPGVFLLYLFWLFLQTGDPLAFIHAQKTWKRHLTWPYESLILSWQTLGTYGYLNAHFVLTSIDLAATLLFWLLVVIGIAQKLPFAYILYMLYSLLIPMSAPVVGDLSPLMSMSRFVVVIFPGFLVLAKLAERFPAVDRLVTITFPLLQSLFFLFFVGWIWLA